MRRKALLMVGLALLLAAGGAALASNMGFKFVKAHTAGTNTLALPYLQFQYPTARSLFNGVPGATQVCRMNLNESRDCWLGDFTGSLNWKVAAGEGYIVRVTTATTHVLVGSHDPLLVLRLKAGGSQLVPLPYHATYITLAHVFMDIPGAREVCRLNPNESRDCWLGDFAGSPNPLVKIGDALVIRVASDVTWTPEHY